MNDAPSNDATAPVSVTVADDVAIVRLDDGKANALGHDMLDGIERALDEVQESAARAVVVIGREGRFSAGFDLKVMQAGSEEAKELLGRGARLGIRLLEFPMPVVFAVTGHALAMGGILLCCADVRVGAQGQFKIGLPEVRIGMPVPGFAVEICRARLSPRWFSRSLFLGLSHSPDEAAEAGYLDEVVPPQEVERRALEVAADAAAAVDPTAFAASRRTMNGALLATLDQVLVSDVEEFFVNG